MLGAKIGNTHETTKQSCKILDLLTGSWTGCYGLAAGLAGLAAGLAGLAKRAAVLLAWLGFGLSGLFSRPFGVLVILFV